MTTRTTSAEAYRSLVENGGLAQANRTVYRHLYQNGPQTQKQTERALKDTTYTMRPRFRQLCDMGLIQEVGSIQCPETNNKNLLWDVTDNVIPFPVEKIKEPTKKQWAEAVRISEVALNWLHDTKADANEPEIKAFIKRALNKIQEELK